MPRMTEEEVHAVRERFGDFVMGCSGAEDRTFGESEEFAGHTDAHQDSHVDGHQDFVPPI